MPYATRSDLEALVPSERLAEALKGTGGTETTGLLTAILAAADTQVNAYLENSYTTPLTTPYPAIVKRAAAVFALETVWQRKGLSGEQSNPWAGMADKLRDRLDDIGRGALKMTNDEAVGAFDDALTSKFADTSVSTVTEDEDDE